MKLDEIFSICNAKKIAVCGSRHCSHDDRRLPWYDSLTRPICVTLEDG